MSVPFQLLLMQAIYSLPSVGTGRSICHTAAPARSAHPTLREQVASRVSVIVSSTFHDFLSNSPASQYCYCCECPGASFEVGSLLHRPILRQDFYPYPTL